MFTLRSYVLTTCTTNCILDDLMYIVLHVALKGSLSMNLSNAFFMPRKASIGVFTAFSFGSFVETWLSTGGCHFVGVVYFVIQSNCSTRILVSLALG